MKNGFTLIELLAVIVILAIIALIAVPIVLNIINDSKESSLLRSAEFYLDAAEYTIADAFLYHGGLEDKEYPIDINGDICKIELDNEGNCPKTGDKSNTLKVEVNGDKPTGGSITINGGNISNVSLVLDEKTIVKNSKGELVYLKYLDEVCTLVSGTAKTAGAKYTCKVDPNKEAYTFYVLTTLSATDTSINLIMDSNINSDGTPTTKAITKANKDNNDGIYNLVAWNSSGSNTGGPITAMNFLQEATKNWSNTNEIKIDSFNFYDVDGIFIDTYEMKIYKTKARLPYKSEVYDSNGSNNYLYNNLHLEGWYGTGNMPESNISEIYGYWTLASYYGNYPFAWFVNSTGNVICSVAVNDEEYNGVRPVINLKL